MVNRERDGHRQLRDWMLVSTSGGAFWGRAWQLLSPMLGVVAVYDRQRVCPLTLARYGRILLEVAEPARARLRDRLRQIEREQYSLLENTRLP